MAPFATWFGILLFHVCMEALYFLIAMQRYCLFFNLPNNLQTFCKFLVIFFVISKKSSNFAPGYENIQFFIGV